MQLTQVSKADCPPDVEPVIRHVVPWRVAAVTALEGYRLNVMFVDGTKGEVELDSFLNGPSTNGTVFEALRDPAAFAQVRVVLGTVQWANGADLAPDAMYDAIKANGRWTVD
ncbi:MAG: DUF2442 domain-containing protein [Nitrospira sp.]|nr:DUF2442 domain-containing protein [Nitrospira sp.]MDH5194215.1 DUF2442 domain-containing protein [Nitrospira sp.]